MTVAGALTARVLVQAVDPDSDVPHPRTEGMTVRAQAVRRESPVDHSGSSARATTSNPARSHAHSESADSAARKISVRSMPRRS